MMFASKTALPSTRHPSYAVVVGDLKNGGAGLNPGTLSKMPVSLAHAQSGRRNQGDADKGVHPARSNCSD